MQTFCNHPRAANGSCPLCDLSHAALGFVAAVLPPPWRAASGVCFLAYQMLRTKPAAQKLDALNQWGLGYFGGSLF